MDIYLLKGRKKIVTWMLRVLFLTTPEMLTPELVT